MVTSEARPFSFTGGVGETVPGLAHGLRSLGLEISIVLPLYQAVEGLETVLEIDALPGAPHPVRIRRLDGDIRHYFVDCEPLFARQTTQAYPDDGVRFAVFSRAAVALANK